MGRIGVFVVLVVAAACSARKPVTREQAPAPSPPPPAASATQQPLGSDAAQPEAVANSGPPSPAPAPTPAPPPNAIPPENAVTLTAPPPRPTADGIQAEGAQLLAAIAEDNPQKAADFFFPREAFAHVKAIPDPDRYWQRLYARYEQDIHTLHASLPGIAGAKFLRLEVVPRGGWMAVGTEGNALPYWAARHNWLHYEVNGHAERVAVRVLITWGTRWYVTHLSEFH